MVTFSEYADSFELLTDPATLDFEMVDSEYCIFGGSKPLLTPGGNRFSHPSERVIRMMVTDLHRISGFGLRQLSPPVLYSFCKDILLAKGDPFQSDWEGQLTSDLFVLMKCSGKSPIQPFDNDDPLFALSFISLTGMVEIINEFTAKVMSEVVLEESVAQPFPLLLRLSYDRLSPDRRVAVQALGGIHGSGLVLPLLLVAGEITADEYVKSLLSLKIHPKESFAELMAGVGSVQTYLGASLQKEPGRPQLSELTGRGEGDFIEFKSTLRWDIRAGKTSPAIERSCLKTISAFLNSSGGTLLIGVRDDGTIEGVGTDKFANDDKFLLHLWTLIRNCLGRDFTPYIRTRLEKQEEKSICVVECLPANRPVFLRQPGFDEEMYIRLGPSSNAMNISEALTYIEDHFNRK